MMENGRTSGGARGLNRRRPPVLAVPAGAEQRFDFIVIPEERDEQVRRPVLEYEAQRRVAATLEKALPQFANPQATVLMRAAKGLGQLAQR
jgi:hypothetical protein